MPKGEPATKNDPQDVAGVRRITWIGLIANMGLSALKFIAGIVGNSQAVVADAVHSLSDMSTDIAILLGVRYWSAPADEGHPYGHGRIETMITAALGLVLAVVAVGIGYNAIVTVREEHIRQPERVAFIAAAASIVIKEVLYRWTVAAGKRAKSTAVVANAWHHRSDALSSIAAAAAVAIALIDPKWSFIDHIGALIVSLIIMHASWRIVRPALRELADSGVPKELCDQIEALVTDIADVREAHAIRARRLGSGVHVDLHITVDSGLTVQQGHDISETVKQLLIKQGPDIVDVVEIVAVAIREKQCRMKNAKCERLLNFASTSLEPRISILGLTTYHDILTRRYTNAQTARPQPRTDLSFYYHRPPVAGGLLWPAVR
jgi:cation diffusion facilitator family transporter